MRYISREDEVLWKVCNQPGPPPTTWAEFKTKVQELYPGSDGVRMFTLKDLQTLLGERSLKKIRDKVNFSEYHRRFCTIASHLLAEGKMSTIEEQREFPKGMDEHFRNRVYRRLQIVKPHHPSDTPYALEDMVKAAKHILDEPADTGADGTDNSFIKKEMTVAPPAMYQPPERPQGGYRPQYPGNQSFQREPWANRDNGMMRPSGMFQPGECMFCSATGHFLRECPLAAEYMRAGKCFRNNDGKLVLPNGRFVPRGIVGQNLAERIDRYLSEGNPQNQPPPNPGPPRPAQTQTFERDQPPHTPGPKFPSPPVPPKAAPAKPLHPQPDRPGQPPAFKYQVPIENPTLVKAVIQRALKTEMTISNEELCAISPEFRKYYRENTVTKWIPTVEISMIAAGDEDGEGMEERPALVLRWEGQDEPRGHLLTASPIDSLRVLDVLVNDTLTVACTLDQGSEIVAMNRPIWQQLGVSLSPDKTLIMESADSNQSTTAGVVENLKITVGDIDLLLQVHIVDGAPFDILMGRPFFRFTECQTKDRTDGTQELTITCPNTGKVIAIPTWQKPPKPSHQAEVNPFQTFDIEGMGFA
ncbi:hypothetical protein FB451DRAFT_1058078 [Mycena latifolia]|nr:hypothetical protein FB451DRAFT_1058078 [Mycena latifolia]